METATFHITTRMISSDTNFKFILLLQEPIPFLYTCVLSVSWKIKAFVVKSYCQASVL